MFHKTILLLIFVGVLGSKANRIIQTGRNFTSLSELIKNNLHNKTNFEKTKEIFEEFFNNTELIDFKLPESLIPERYSISFVPDFDNLTFDGDVSIFGKPSDNIYNKNIITLNADTLNITDVFLIDLTNGVNYTIISTAMLDNLQRFVINLREDLNPHSDYQLSMNFDGKLRSKHGFFVTTYSSKNESPILMTEFQATNARYAFPCWDEPKYKAKFTIRVAREPDLVALSNMPLNSTSEPDQNLSGKVWDLFQESPDMSTYLVALVVGDLGVLRDDDYNVSIWTEPGKEMYGEFALNFTKNLIDKLEEFTGVNYSLPKLDQVATPSLCVDALENWGVIAYIDSYLLVEDEESENEKQEVAYHIAHELSHQWFGNLVTFEWWNNVWLNEGFAQFFQYLITDSLEPDWRAMDSFVVNELQYILSKDAYVHTHPLSEKNIETADEIASMFDNISYLKGGSIIRMFYHIMTPDIFRKGINRYLEENSLKSVTDKNLWESFRQIDCSELELPADIEDIMRSWIHEEGYPVIQMKRTENATGPVHSITLTQKYYLTEQHSNFKDTDDKAWWIPLTYTTSTELEFDETESKEWFNITADEHTLNIYLEEDEWIILNIQLTGFYRVNYDNLTWNLIIDDMVDYGFTDIHPLNRAALLDDAYRLGLSGYIDIEVFMNLTRYLLRETDMIPWTTAFTIFKELDSSLEGTPAQPLLHRYIQWLTSCWYAEIGFSESENDTVSTKLSRMMLLDVACSFRHKKCSEKALEHVYLMMSEADMRLPTNLEEVHLCVAIREGPSEVWQYARKRYIELHHHKGSRESLLDAMACSTDRAIIKQMLKDSVDKDSFFVKNDGSYLIGIMITEMEVENVDLVLDFLAENLNVLLSMHGETKVTSYFLRIALKLNKNSSKVYNFIDDHKIELKNIYLSLKSKLRFIKYSLVRAEYYNKVYEWLNKEEINFGQNNTENYEAMDEDDNGTTTAINEDSMGNISEFTTVENNILTSTIEYSIESEENDILNNITSILEKTVDKISSIETATELINTKLLPKIPLKETDNGNNSIGVKNNNISNYLYLLNIIFLYAFRQLFMLN